MAMFPRKIVAQLKSWSESEYRKPLVLRGARQVGKTTAVEIFSREFDQYAYLNLEKFEDANLFARKLSAEELIEAIFLFKRLSGSPGKKTLLFIDEIQNSPQAMAYMRFFYESANQLHVIAAGSLMETVINVDKPAFPVGRVQYLFMYPLAFDEFLAATGEEKALEYYHRIPFPSLAHPILLKLFHQYVLIGGMPEIVQRHTEGAKSADLTDGYEALIMSLLRKRQLAMDTVQCLFWRQVFLWTR